MTVDRRNLLLPIRAVIGIVIVQALLAAPAHSQNEGKGVLTPPTTASPEPPTPPPPAPAPVESADPRDRELRELDEAIQRDRSNVSAYFNRGNVYAQRSAYPNAIADFSEAIRLDPSYAEAWNNRCWARAVIGQLDLALADCNESLKLRRTVDALDSRGFVHLRLGQLDQAIADYDAVLRLQPQHAASRYGRGLAKLRKGNTAAGNADVAAAKALKPGIEQEFVPYGLK
jgi:tetratricopeptide (TPR) repeat protein